MATVRAHRLGARVVRDRQHEVAAVRHLVAPVPRQEGLPAIKARFRDSPHYVTQLRWREMSFQQSATHPPANASAGPKLHLRSSALHHPIGEPVIDEDGRRIYNRRPLVCSGRRLPRAFLGGRLRWRWRGRGRGRIRRVLLRWGRRRFSGSLLDASGGCHRQHGNAPVSKPKAHQRHRAESYRRGISEASGRL